jgi:protoheme IX farnesyltransferase
LVGILFLSSGSSALNQLQEHQIDATMPRTAKRPIPSGRLTARQAMAFVISTLIAGISILAYLDVQLVILGLLAVLLYNGLYTLWWKKHWAYAAVPGAIPGALPILMGYVAATGEVFHPSGIYLFLILFYWQMPHFWVLALRFRDDYELGNFPTLPVALGEKVTVFQIVLWCLGYIGIALVAPLFLKVRAIYLAITFPVCGFLLWSLRTYVQNAHNRESKKWLPFFLGVNFSLILFIGAAALDLWSVNLLTSYWVKAGP